MTKFAQKRYFWSQKFGIFSIFSLSTKFDVKQQTKFAPKRYFSLKVRQMNTTIEFSTFKLVKISTFVLNKHFSIFGTNLPKRCISCLKHHHQIQHIWVTLSTKFYLNQTTCQDQTSLRRVFLFSKTKIEQNHGTQHVLVNVGIKFHLTKTVLIFRTKLSKKAIFHSRQKNWTSSSNSACSIQFGCQISF